MAVPIYSSPQSAPLYAAPPYKYNSYRKVSVFCRVAESEIRRFLPPAFDVRGDVIEFFIMNVPDGGALGSYKEGGIVVPVSYSGRSGGHVLYEIVTNDDSMAVGREVWGYPKKMGNVEWWDNGGLSAKASLSRRGTDLIKIEFTGNGQNFEKPVLHPRFQTRIVPSPEGPEVQTQIIENSLGESLIRNHSTGTATIELGGNPSDPFSDFKISDIVGAEFVVADFVLGYGKVVS